MEGSQLQSNAVWVTPLEPSPFLQPCVVPVQVANLTDRVAYGVALRRDVATVSAVPLLRPRQRPSYLWALQPCALKQLPLHRRAWLSMWLEKVWL